MPRMNLTLDSSLPAIEVRVVKAILEQMMDAKLVEMEHYRCLEPGAEKEMLHIVYDLKEKPGRKTK